MVDGPFCLNGVRLAARAYVPPQPDDGHTNLGWDDTLDGFTTHRMQGGMCLSLEISDLTLVLHGNERTARTESFSLNGTDAQAHRWLGEQLGARGLDARALDVPSPMRCLRTQPAMTPPMMSRMWQMLWSSLLHGSPMPNFSFPTRGTDAQMTALFLVSTKIQQGSGYLAKPVPAEERE